jgi:hypothetical protein
MRASHPFIARHLIAIHIAAWTVCVFLFLVDAYLDLPHPLSVPFSAYAILIGAPLIIVTSFGAPPPAPSLPQSLRNFMRLSPWGFGALWGFCIFVVVAEIVGDIRIRNILH